MSASAGPPRATSSASRTTWRKPRISLFLATALGLGYIPLAPGTFGSLLGVLVALIPFRIWAGMGAQGVQSFTRNGPAVDPLLLGQTIGGGVIAIAGVWTASRAARYWQQEDPQRVVIDEVSGQHLTLVLGSILPVSWRPVTYWGPRTLGFLTYQSALNWKYLLLGFILFRVFDIWKPFPVRNAESLPRGWGIMADDWLAGIYAALGLWAARAVGL
jgi:phosphatidylglycerophosphatase A